MTSVPKTRGSEWRMWDLHVHAPGTKLADQFGRSDTVTWDTYCRMLHESTVQAFGITDYFSAESYFKVVEEYQGRHGDCPKLFLPNIELRTSDVVNREGEEVNIHLIFNPLLQDLRTSLRRFLENLKTNKTDSNDREIRVTELSSTRDFESATTTRQFIQDAIKETFGTRFDRADLFLVVTAANNDGIRPARGKRRKELITDELDKFSNGLTPKKWTRT